MGSIRLGGAQIPVGTNIQANKKEILKALDWAKENEVNHLLTPEAALSGWTKLWVDQLDELQEALTEIEAHQKTLGVGLHLGTNFQEDEDYGKINRNEIRHYSKEGYLTNLTFKTSTIGAMECVLYRDSRWDPLSMCDLATSDCDTQFLAGGLICNDFWGTSSSEGVKDPIAQYKDIGVCSLLLHATNGRTFPDDAIDWEIFDEWHNAHLRMATYSTQVPVLTVDSCTDWDWDGNEEDVDLYKTSSQSGVIAHGEWLTDVPRRGRQYFKYDMKEWRKILSQ